MRALLSVYDKAGLVELAGGLVDLGWELIASGKTAAALADAGIAATEVAHATGAPEILGGRVKTLHPKVHGGILADRSNPSHLADLAAQRIEAIDLVVCNLYPFSSDPSIEMIDIGGPTMVRAAAKNHAHVGVVVDPADYPAVLEELRRERAHCWRTRVGDWHAPPLPTPPRTTPPSWSGSTPEGRGENPSCSRPRCTWRSSGPRSFATARPPPTAAPAIATGAPRRGGTAWCSTAAWRCRTSTCSTPMRPGDWWPSCAPIRSPLSPSSNTPTPAAPPSARRSPRRTGSPASATRSRLSAAWWPWGARARWRWRKSWPRAPRPTWWWRHRSTPAPWRCSSPGARPRHAAAAGTAA